MGFDVTRARQLASTSQDIGKLSRCIEDACDEIQQLQDVLIDVERYFGNDVPPAGFPMGGVRRALMERS